MPVDEPSQPSSPPLISFEAQYNRVFEAAECRTQIELADFLEVRQSSISDAKRRSSIPSDWLIKLFEKRRINPEWVRKGTGAKILLQTSADGADFPSLTEHKLLKEYTTDELLAELMRRALRHMS